jgi:hypothetical protein
VLEDLQPAVMRVMAREAPARVGINNEGKRIGMDQFLLERLNCASRWFLLPHSGCWKIAVAKPDDSTPRAKFVKRAMTLNGSGARVVMIDLSGLPQYCGWQR